MTITIVDIYCRTATGGPEARTTLEQQEAACRAYCERQGLVVSLVHSEVAPGMTYLDREQLTRLRRRYRDSHIQGVVVTHVDCLSRSNIHLIILMQEMEAHLAELYCVHEHIAETLPGRFARTFLAFAAEVEREKALDTLLTELER